MAEGEKKSYPMLPVAHWWTLRKRFKQSIPGVVTDGYIASVLGMEAKSARGNVLPYLRTLGIIDDEGRTGERAKQWRDDERYPAVCKQMREEVYPKDLLDAVTSEEERGIAERWFAHETGAGEVGVRRMSGLFMTLLEADASKAPDDKPDRARPERSRAVPARASLRPIEARYDPAPALPASPASTARSSAGRNATPPGININLQIHISSDATPDQIDAIFASMAKHIYNSKTE